LDVHGFNTKSNHDLHIALTNLTVHIFQKAVWYSGIKIYNRIPPALKQLSCNILKFNATLKRFLLTNPFYTMEEYYSWKSEFWFLVLHFNNAKIIVLLFNYCLIQIIYDYRYILSYILCMSDD
jgi:hypothetical protein